MSSLFDPRIEKKQLFYVSLAFLLLRMLILQQYVTTNPFFSHPISDSEMYLQWAESILEGNRYFAQEYHHPPGYAGFLAPVLWISGSNLYAILVLQCLMVTVQSLLVFYSTKKLFGVKAAWLAFVLYSVCGPVAFYSMKILSETLYTTIVLAAFCLLLRFLESAKPLHIFLSGLFLGLAIEVRGNAMILLLPSLVAALATPLQAKGRFRAALTFCIGVAIVITPVLIRNIRVAGASTPVASNWGENFYFGNNETATGGVPLVEGIRTNIFDQILDVQKEASRRAGRQLTSLEAQRFWFHQGLTFVRTKPLDWLQLEWLKFRRMLQDLLPSGIYSYPLEVKLYHPYLRFTIGYGWIFPLFAAGLMAIPWNRKTVIFLAYLLLQIAVLMLYWPEERYLLPVLPFLMMGAGCIALISKDTIRNTKRPAISVAMILLCLYVNLRPIRPGGFAAWYANASAAHFSKQEFKQSEILALEALKTDAKYVEAWTNLGSALYSQNKITEARKSWLQALRLKPSEVIAARNLAISYETENRQRALEWWQRTLINAQAQELPPQTIAVIKQRIVELQ